MSKYICLTITALLIFTTGCDEYEYAIEMTPDAGLLKRTISFSSNLPDEQKQAVKKFYPEQIDANTFSGTFRVDLPNDVGGRVLHLLRYQHGQHRDLQRAIPWRR